MANKKIKADLVIDGEIQTTNIPHETTDVDKFLVSNAGLIKYRTGAEVSSDIGSSSSRNVDGGTWDSVYLPEQNIDGGTL